MSNWSWLQNATSVQMDSCYIRYKVFGITVSKTQAPIGRGVEVQDEVCTERV